MDQPQESTQPGVMVDNAFAMQAALDKVTQLTQENLLQGAYIRQLEAQVAQLQALVPTDEEVTEDASADDGS